MIKSLRWIVFALAVTGIALYSELDVISDEFNAMVVLIACCMARIEFLFDKCGSK